MNEEDQNITNSPVTTQIGNSNSATSNDSGVNPITIVGQPRKKKEVDYRINPAEITQSKEVLSQMGYADVIGRNAYINNPYGADYFKNRWMGIEFDPVSTETQDEVGGINPFAENYDFEHLRRQSQGTLAAAGNVATQFVGKTLVNATGGIVAGFYGLGASIAQGVKNLGIDDDKQPSALPLLWDNSVSRGFDRATEWVDQNNTVFTSEYARQNQSPINIFNVEGAKNLSDGMSFVTGAVLSEVTMAALSAGVGNAIKATSLGLRVANTMSKTGKATANVLGAIDRGARRAVGLDSLKGYGAAIKRASQLSDEVMDIARMTTGSDVAKLERMLPVGMTIADLQKLTSTVNFINSIPRRGRKLVTGTSWEAGLEARQNQDEFYENNIEKVKGEIALMTHLSDEEKRKLFELKERDIKKMSQDVGFGVFALNTALLQVGNMIQFPTIFGLTKTAKPRSAGGTNIFGMQLSKGSFKKTGKTLSDSMYQLRKTANAKLVAKSFAHILKKPITEGLEEMNQSAVGTFMTNYYDDKLNNPFQDYILDSANAEFATELNKSMFGILGESLKETYTDEDAYKEGVIGFIMGAIGSPMFKKNKNGKLRPTMVGGVAEDIRAVRKTISDRKLNLIALNSQADDLNSILGMNKEQAVINKKLSDKDDLANLTGNERIIHDNQEQRISDYVSKMKKMGLESQMEETLGAIYDADFNEYKAMFDKDDTFTEQEMNQEKQRVKESVKRYSEAFDTIYKHLSIDSYKEDSTTTKMIDILVNAIGYEKYARQKEQVLIDKLLEFGITRELELSADVIKSLIENSAEFEGVKNEYDKIVAQLSNSRKEDLKAKIESLAQEAENYLTSLPKELIEPSRALMAAIESNDETAIIEATLALNTVILTNSSPIAQNEIKQQINELVSLNKNVRLNQKIFTDPTTLEEWAMSEDPEKVKVAKKAIEEVRKRLNESLSETHREETKNLLDQAKDQGVFGKIKMSQILSYFETNKLFNSLEKELREELENSNMSDALVKEVLDIQSIKNELLLSANKRLATTQLAKEMLEMGGYNAYNKIQRDTYNAGLNNLRSAIIEADFARINNDENEIVFNAVRIQTIMDKLAVMKQEMIDKKILKEDDFKPTEPLINQAKELLKLLDQYITKADMQDAAKEEAVRKANEMAKQNAFKQIPETDSDTGELKLSIGTIDQNLPGSTNYEKVEQGQPERIYLEGINPENGQDPSLIGDKSSGGVTTSSSFTPASTKSSASSKKDQAEIVADINSQTATTVNPKRMFTISGNTNSVNNRDIREGDNTTLQSRIDDGTIQYNSGGTLQIPTVDPLLELSSTELISYENAIFSEDEATRAEEKAKYLRGLEKLNAQDGVDHLMVDNISEIDPDVLFYISKARVITNFYSDKVSINRKGKQNFTITDDSEVVHSMYLFAVDASNLNQKGKDTNISENYSAHIKRLAEIDNEYFQKLEQNKLEYPDPIERALRDEEAADERVRLKDVELLKYHSKAQLNDIANLSLRINAFKNHLNRDKDSNDVNDNVTKFRVGNFLNGILPASQRNSSIEGSILVNTYELSKGENALFPPEDPFTADKLAYVDNNGILRSLKTKEAIKLNEGSFIDKDYLSSGAIYGIRTTTNGQRIPIKLNMEGFDSPMITDLEGLTNELRQIILDYVNLKEKTKERIASVKIKLPENSRFSYAQGMTYPEFFSSISRSWKSNTDSISQSLGGFINIKGDTFELNIGGTTISETTDEAVMNDNLETAFSNLRRNRFFLNRAALFQGKDNTLNQKYLDFLLDNNILTHTLESSNLKDGMFERPEGTNVKMQIHLLNDVDAENLNIQSKKVNTFDRKRTLIHNILFGRSVGKSLDKDPRMGEQVSTKNLMQGVLKAVSSKLTVYFRDNPNLTEEEKVEALNNVIDDIITTKLRLISELIINNPELRTDNLVEWLNDGGLKSTRKKYDLSNANYLELYTHTFLKFLSKIKGNQAYIQPIIAYGSNLDISREIRALLINTPKESISLQNFSHADRHNPKPNQSGVYYPSNKPNENTTTLDSEIHANQAKINSLETRLKLDTTSESEKVKIREELEIANKNHQDLVIDKVNKINNIATHLFTIGIAIDSAFAVENSFGNKQAAFPLFNINHTKLGHRRRSGNWNPAAINNNYRLSPDGEITKLNPKDTSGDFNLENGSLVTDRSNSPFQLVIFNGKKGGKGSYLNTSDLKDLGTPIIKRDKQGNITSITSGKIKFDPKTGNMMNASLVARMYDTNYDKTSKFKFTVQNKPLIIGDYVQQESGDDTVFSNFGEVLSSVSIPGINADFTIDNSVTEHFDNLISNYSANRREFDKLTASEVKEDPKVKYEEAFGIMPDAKIKDSSSESMKEANEGVTFSKDKNGKSNTYTYPEQSKPETKTETETESEESKSETESGGDLSDYYDVEDIPSDLLDLAPEQSEDSEQSDDSDGISFGSALTEEQRNAVESIMPVVSHRNETDDFTEYNPTEESFEESFEEDSLDSLSESLESFRNKSGEVLSSSNSRLKQRAVANITAIFNNSNLTKNNLTSFLGIIKEYSGDNYADNKELFINLARQNELLDNNETIDDNLCIVKS